MIESNHPRPQFERTHWRSLNGPWQFAFDPQQQWRDPEDVTFDLEIQVPYCPESELSGLSSTGYHPVVWYKKTLELHSDDFPERGGRLLLHFEAVDYSAKVWVNGQMLTEHRGGHTPFFADVTDVLNGKTSLEIVLKAEDDPLDLAKPRGKQDWLEEPHAIWYPRTTGIWQEVWLEKVPAVRIGEIRWTPYIENWEFGLDVTLEGELTTDLWLRVRLLDDGVILADDRYAVLRDEISRRISVTDPGIDDFRDHLLWHPHHPHLIRAIVELITLEEGREKVLDQILSYTAMRSVSLTKNGFLLNGRPFYLRLVLDQGYWAESLMTAPTDAHLRRDVELTKQLGFNGVRKHQKLESQRYLFWCDVLGLVVWEEMPSPYRFNTEAIDRLVGEWMEAIKRDISHPCIVTWVPLNESWGVPDLPNNAAHRNYVRALYFLTRTLDPTRPVIGNDGWENVATDMIGIHDYSDNPDELFTRYGNFESASQVIARKRPGGRQLVLDNLEIGNHPVILSEFGGIAYSAGGGWGYSRAHSAENFLERYQKLLAAVSRCEGLAGFCYTQLTDTFQEENGLLYMDRTPKVDMQKLARATVNAVPIMVASADTGTPTEKQRDERLQGIEIFGP